MGTRQPRWEALLPYAVEAPSSHNTQPWLFRVAEDGRLRVLADRSRGLPVVDPDGRELVMSCGAAVAHLEVALRGLGRAADVATFPDPTDPDLLAVVGSPEPRTASPRDHELLDAIHTRRTHRTEFAPGVIGSGTLARLRSDVEALAAVLTVLTGDDRRALVTLVGEGDRVQFGDPAFRRELATWMRPNQTRRRDGIRGDALGLGAVTSLLAPTLVATFDTGARQAAKDEQLALTAPALLVLSTQGDTPSDWLSAGRAVALLLLGAAAQGLAASFLNQPIEVPALRARLRTLLGGATHPQLLLRVGPAGTAAESLRRPVSDVVVPRAG